MSEQESAGNTSEDVYEESVSAETTGESGAGESTTATAEPPAEAEEERPLFSEQELAQFDADDAKAGSHIGKMLALFFLYTVLAMLGVALWTLSTLD